MKAIIFMLVSFVSLSSVHAVPAFFPKKVEGTFFSGLFERETFQLIIKSSPECIESRSESRALTLCTFNIPVELQIQSGSQTRNLSFPKVSIFNYEKESLTQFYFHGELREGTPKFEATTPARFSVERKGTETKSVYGDLTLESFGLDRHYQGIWE